MSASLFDPIKLGALELPNRILMAPMTRGRATRDHVPTPLMAEYYAQRACAGLIITEATGISQQSLGWPYAPGIWSDTQVDAWKPIVEAVHAKGGRILAQLWHMGRVVHPDFLGGAAPVSSSAIAAPDQAHTYAGKKPYTTPRALRVDEVPALLEDYRRAARNALAAGFDGVQIHAANGYLIDQFLRDNTNMRTDEYGGSIASRTRLLREVVEVVVEMAGAKRTSVRLSPNGEIQGVDDSDAPSLFTAAAGVLAPFGLAFLELREPGFEGTFGKASTPPVALSMKAAFMGPVVLNSDYHGPKAEAALASGAADAISFGRTFLANPDLPHRIRAGVALAEDDPTTWYTQGPEGYVDYPKAE